MVFRVVVILGQKEPSVSLMDLFVAVFEPVSKEFDCDMSFFLFGVFHPITTILRGCLDKVRGP